MTRVGDAGAATKVTAAGPDEAGGYTTPQAVARHLAVSVKLVYKLARRRELEAVKVGRSVRILVASVREFIARHTVRREATPPAARAPGPTPTPRPSPRPRRAADPAGFVFLPP
jgi:excisionase family DNA binding protein